MQVTQTSTQGLKQEFKVVLPAADLAAKLGAQLAEVQAKAQIKGFRPGKAPIGHLRKLYGKSIMGDVLQEAVNEANRKIVEDHQLRIAVEPKLEFPGGQDEVERALSAEGDFAFTVTFETLPKFEVGALDDISLERPIAEVSEDDIATALKNLADRVQEFEPRAEGSKAEKGDKLTIDFTGKLDGVPFEGGTGGDIDIVLGSNTFIPGFEEQLEGVAVGEEKLVKVKFPEDYSAAHLAGKDAEFEVTVKGVAAPKALEVGEELATKYGFENFEAMKTAVKGNLEADFHKVSRDRLKRALLDALDSRYSFELPETLVEQEFNNIWTQHEAESKRSGQPLAEEGKTEEETRAEFRKIAERRVRLGLVLAEIGQEAGVKVEDKDLTEALVERARMFPGQEKQVWDFYRNNEQALAQLRAPIYEERVVDHISKLIKITDKTVSKDELFKDEDEA
jgi:trigger factor